MEELGKCTPICQLLPSTDKVHLKVLENYLSGDNSACFESYNNAKAMTEAFPFPVRIMQMIEKEENGIPDDVRSIFKAMITLKREYSVIARERAMVRKKPGSGFSPPECEIYPLFPIHTMEYAYEADDKPDEGDSEHCNKDYNESATISGGITHITCQHSICKGFTAIGKGTS